MNKYKLLIADHNKDQCAVLEKYFSSVPEFDVQPSVQNGEKALQRAVLGDIDVMIMDVVLPGLDGLEVLYRIKNKGLSDPPKVFIHSAISLDPVLRLSQSLNALYYFQKPIEPSVMCRRVLEFLECSAPAKISNAPEFSVVSEDFDSEDVITDLIRQMHIPASLKGYHYAKSCVSLFIEHINTSGYGMTTHIYPAVAKMYDTTPSRVERAIRHAISVAWSRSSPEELSRMFGYAVNKNKAPFTNSEFIAMLADRTAIKLKSKAR